MRSLNWEVGLEIRIGRLDGGVELVELSWGVKFIDWEIVWVRMWMLRFTRASLPGFAYSALQLSGVMVMIFPSPPPAECTMRFPLY